MNARAKAEEMQNKLKHDARIGGASYTHPVDFFEVCLNQARNEAIAEQQEKIKELEETIKQISKHVEDTIYGKVKICSFRYLIYTILKPSLNYADAYSLGLQDLNNALIEAVGNKAKLTRLEQALEVAREALMRIHERISQLGLGS